MTESIFTSGGILELLNQKNGLVIINLDNYLYLSNDQVKLLAPENVKVIFKVGTEICFRLTEPCLQTFVPKVSEAKLGSVKALNAQNVLTIELREDFKIKEQE